jgi:hypothetical protein
VTAAGDANKQQKVSMPNRRPDNPALGALAKSVRKPTFRQRYDNLEQARTELLDRLERYGEMGRTHPSFKRAVILLNETFRKSSITQRAAVLQSASWLVQLIENSIGLI